MNILTYIPMPMPMPIVVHGGGGSTPLPHVAGICMGVSLFFALAGTLCLLGVVVGLVFGHEVVSAICVRIAVIMALLSALSLCASAAFAVLGI